MGREEEEEWSENDMWVPHRSHHFFITLFGITDMWAYDFIISKSTCHVSIMLMLH